MFLKCCLCLFVTYWNFIVVKNEYYNLYGYPGEGYWMNVELGEPPQKFTLVVDTGSGSLGVAATNNNLLKKYYDYKNSTTFISTGKKVSAVYTSGKWSGDLITDVVSLPSIPLAPKVRTDIALINKSEDFFMSTDFQGILGLAYPDAAANHSGTWLQAVDDAMGKKVNMQMKLCGVRSLTNASHYGSFQIIDENTPKLNTNKTYLTPLLRKSFYAIAVLNVRMLPLKDTNTVSNPKLNQNVCLELNEQMSILDSGSTSIVLPEKFYNELLEEFTNMSDVVTLSTQLFDSGRGLLCSEGPVNWNYLPRIAIDLLSADDRRQFFTLEIPPQSYMHLVFSKPLWGSGPRYCYKFCIQPGRSTILGVAGLEGFLITFDRTNSVIGFQTSDCGPNVRITGPYEADHRISQYCNLSESTPEMLESIKTAQWAVLSILTVAMTLVAYVMGPTIRDYYKSRFTSSPPNIPLTNEH